jgi:uncharacterized membrane protein
MRFHRSSAGVAVFAATGLIAAGASSAVGVASYRTAPPGDCSPTTTQLPDIGYGGEAIAIAGNEIVGGVMDASGVYHPAIWRHGNLRVVGRFALGEALDVNNGRQVVGVADKQRIAWSEEPGQGFVRLQNTDGSSGRFSIYARRVSDDGKIAGAVDAEQYGARWDSATAEPTVLMPAAGDSYSIARGINDAGWAVGDTDDANFVPRAAAWDPGNTVHVYDGAYGAGTPSILYQINDAMQAVGESFKVNGQGQILKDVATSWTAAGQPASLGFLPHDNQSTALDVSPSGFVSGESSGMDYVSGQPTRPTHAFVWDGDGPIQSLPVPGLGYRHSESVAHAITDEGTAVGFAGPLDGSIYPYVWTCVFDQAFRPSAAAAAAEPRPGLGAWRPAALRAGGGFAPHAPRER